MDVHMPVMDGIEATRVLRASAATTGALRIVALTADVSDKTRERCFDVQMDDVLYKPVVVEQLVDVMRRYFRDDGSARLNDDDQAASHRDSNRTQVDSFIDQTLRRPLRPGEADYDDARLPTNNPNVTSS